MEQRNENTWIYAVCIFGVLLLPLVILLLIPKGNGGMYAKIESKLSDAIVEYNQREHRELCLTTSGEDQAPRTDRIWISGDNWRCDTVVITPDGQKTFATLQYEGILYRCEDGVVTCTEKTQKCAGVFVDRMQMAYNNWERQRSGAFTAWGEIEAAVAEQQKGLHWQESKYEVDWLGNLRRVTTTMKTVDGAPKQTSTLEILGWNKKLCKEQIEAAYADMQALLEGT